MLDGKTSNFTEVGALLRKRGIDLDNNRFLILQGEVEQIAMMPPKVRVDLQLPLYCFIRMSLSLSL
jgi:chromosome segregation ATPase